MNDAIANCNAVADTLIKLKKKILLLMVILEIYLLL